MSKERTQAIARRYQIVQKLGQGGVGAVFKSFDRLNRQHVALKQLQTEEENLSLSVELGSETMDARVNLAHEFQVLASLRHPHVINVQDYGFDETRQPFFTMSLLDNPTTIVEVGRDKTLAERINLLIQMLQALAYLHRRGIVHRDLKPDNALVNTQQQVKVLDFGFATVHDQRTEEEKSSVSGTLAYIAPEVLQGEPASQASDLYAVGVMAYQLFAGSHPFDLNNIGQLVNDVLMTPPDLDAMEMALMNETGIYTPVDSGDSSGEILIIKSDPDLSEMAGNSGDSDSLLIITDDVQPPDDRPSGESVMETTAPTSTGTPEAPNISILVNVVDRLMAKMPEDRFTDADEVIAVLSESIGQPFPEETVAIRESYLQSARFVGRDIELDLLQRALRMAVKGQSSAWLVGGENGIGKSRLLEELRTYSLVQGALVLHGQCIAEGGLSYQLWRNPMRRLVLSFDISEADAAVLKEIVPDISEILERDIPDAPELEGQARQQRLLNTIGSVFQTLDYPTVIMLEDLQWAAESLEVLRQLLDTMHGLPLMIVATYRHDEKPTMPEELSGMEHIKLERLTAIDIAEISESMLGEIGRQQEVLELLNRETEGNVFFLVEVVRALAEEAGRLAEIGRDTLPEEVFSGGIEEVIRRRLMGVPEEARLLLNLSAAIGRDVDQALLAALEPEADIENWLTICSNLAVLEVQTEQWRFAYDRLRDGILTGIPDEERQSLHSRIADTLQQIHSNRLEEYAAIIGDHYEQAGQLDKAAHWLARGGIYAHETHAVLTAINLYRRVLAYWDTDDFDFEIDQQQQISVYGRLGLLLVGRGEHEEALQHITLSRELAVAAGERALEANAYRNLAALQINTGDFKAATESLREAEVIAREVDAKVDLTFILYWRSMIMGRSGEFHEALELCEQIREIADEIQHRTMMAMVRSQLGTLNWLLGNYQKASEYYEQAYVFAMENNERQQSIVVVNNIGELSKARGDYQGALLSYEEALKLVREIGIRPWEIQVLCNLGGALAALERYDEADETLLEVIEMSESIPFPNLPEAYSYQAKTYLGQQRYADSLQSGQTAIKLAEESENPELIGLAWRMLGLVATQTKVVLEDGEEPYTAAMCFGKAHEVYSEAGMEGEIARTLRDWAVYELQSGDRERGEEMWNQAREAFERIGADMELASMKEMPA